MRKSLLTLAISMITLTSSAQELVLSQPATLEFPASNTTTFKAPTMRAATENPSGFDFCLCYPQVSAFGLNAAGSIGAAMQLDNATVTRYAGAKVTAILIANGSAQNTTNPKPQPITLFSATELGKTDVMTMEDNMDLNNAYAYKEYPLETPITLEAGKPLWFGFTCTPVTTSYFPLVLDMFTSHDSNEKGGYIGIKTAGTTMNWDDFASDYGFACIKVRLETENLPLNEVSIGGANYPDLVSNTSPFTLQLILANRSVNALESIDYTVTINNITDTEKSRTFEEPINGYNSITVLDIPVQCETDGVNQVKVSVNKVNGIDCTPVEKQFSVTTMDGDGYPKAFVIEEGTGTWCGYCPQGIVAIETLLKNHPDGKIIPIAVHYQDAMSTSSYDNLWQIMQSWPNAMVNRDPSIGLFLPEPTILESVYKQLESAVSFADVKITNVTEQEKEATVSGTVTFAINLTKTNYRIAIVAIEDNVGPYVQTNNYAGGRNGVMGGWEKKSSRVSTLFNEVARNINSYNGVAGDIPANITKGEPYSFSGTVSIDNVKNLSNCHYAALLFNSNGVIENADAADGPAKTGIEQPEMTESAADAPVRYFNLQGREVTAPAEGQLLIKLQGSRSEKIIF